MEVKHHVAFVSQEGIHPVLDRLGIGYKRFPNSWPESEDKFMGVFDISENDGSWPEVEKLIRLVSLFDYPYTIFSQDEVLSAKWLRVMNTVQKGYPQPKSRYWELTYDNGCPRCGMGVVQKAPIRLAGETKMGKYDFIEPYWAPVLIGKKEVFPNLQQAGLSCYEEWPVINHQSGLPSEVASQLYVTGETTPGLIDAETMPYSVCELCHRRKYWAVTRGMLKYNGNAFPAGVDFVRSHEWFGMGAIAFQLIFVSQRVAKLFVEKGWKGTELQPLDIVCA